jgi:hypothetical protein
MPDICQLNYKIPGIQEIRLRENIILRTAVESNVTQAEHTLT